MKMPKVVITHWVHAPVIELLGKTCEVVPNLTRDALSHDELLARARDADALIMFMPDRVDAALLQACSQLRVIACALKGHDNYDVDACTRHGVWITNVPDLLTVPTAELAIGLLIGVARHVRAGDGLVRSGRFPGWRPVLYGTGLAGKTLGLVGLGAVGQAIAQRLAGFGLTLLYSDSRRLSPEQEAALHVAHVPLEELLGRSDFVLPAVPMRPDTLHLIDLESLRRMKRGAYLVNICRGSVVDEQAVSEALASGQLAGYAADVFEMEEWVRPDRPTAIPPSLLENTERTLFTPHLGSAVADVRLAIEMEAAKNVLQALGGQTPSGALNRPNLSKAIA